MRKTLLVIPHYNDTARLKPFLADLIRVLPARFSILVSDDGSENDEREGLSALIRHFRHADSTEGPTLLEPIFHSKNTGTGGAVYRGWSQSDGYSFVAFADADGAISEKEILRAETFFGSDECNAALFACRIKMMGRSIQRSLCRHLTGRVFATLVSELGDIPAYDTQCGFKILKTEAYRKIQPYLKTLGFAFDVELALLLHKLGMNIIEFPVDWHDVPGSKVSLIRDSISMAVEVLKIRGRVRGLSSCNLTRLMQ